MLFFKATESRVETLIFFSIKKVLIYSQLHRSIGKLVKSTHPYSKVFGRGYGDFVVERFCCSEFKFGKSDNTRDIWFLFGIFSNGSKKKIALLCNMVIIMQNFVHDD